MTALSQIQHSFVIDPRSLLDLFLLIATTDKALSVDGGHLGSQLMFPHLVHIVICDLTTAICPVLPHVQVQRGLSSDTGRKHSIHRHCSRMWYFMLLGSLPQP